ncbi:SMC family ATPase, partial [bacterium]|nr:SMC family ATPase [bacterium]
ARNVRDLEKRRTEFETVRTLSDVAAGRNRLRVSFQRFVLGSLFDDVLREASRRLHAMSNKRYHLLRPREQTGGLEVVVYDSHTGDQRPVSTLSGGESFLASLSLALGLSDVVQAYAGGLRLDTILIDEGFGALDPETLDLAFTALIDLQAGNRLVGVISHVPELRERISTRLEVFSGRHGSSARFVG